MAGRFQEGQTVGLRISDGEGAREYTTKVLRVSGPYLTLRRPAKWSHLNGGESRIGVRPESGGLFTEAEIQEESAQGLMRVRCVNPPQNVSQRREMVRQADELPIWFRVISPSEHNRRKVHFECDAFSPPVSGGGAGKRAAQEGGGPDSLALECLRDIGHKLDQLIELMIQSRQEISLERSGTVRDISGSGLRFQTDQSVDAGAFLEFRIHLVGRGVGPIPGLAEVKRVEEYVSLEGERYWEVAIHFTAISEPNRDQIVARIFQKERELLKRQ